ncbi:MAG: hypothetical protein LBF80_03735 [Spirochaetaceae bacterium]|nr:hypothetical protein [Spirochaetaceae bacterium]
MKDDRESAKRSIDALKVKLTQLTTEPGKNLAAIPGVSLYRQPSSLL